VEPLTERTKYAGRIKEFGGSIWITAAGPTGESVCGFLFAQRCGMVKATKDKTKVVPSSGSVFADLDLANAEEKQTKVRLAVAINHILANQRLSKTAAARSLSVNQPKISALQNYQLEGFSVERLMNFLTALDRDVEIIIRPKSRSRKAGRIWVTAA
jgi:predicted XRE-type DNA-binding protein